MQLQEQVTVKGEEFLLVLCEKENIFNLRDLNIVSIWPKTSKVEGEAFYEIRDYNLYLESLTISLDGTYPDIKDIKPVAVENKENMMKYDNLNYFVEFTGGIVVVKDLVENEDPFICYSYNKVLELKFKKGVLVMTIDHSKSMYKIRKNIELGLRDISIRKDKRCIKKFLKTSLVGNYIKLLKARM